MDISCSAARSDGTPAAQAYGLFNLLDTDQSGEIDCEDLLPEPWVGSADQCVTGAAGGMPAFARERKCH